MNTYTLKCQNCDADLEVEDGLDTFFCKYCGRKIILDGQSDAAYRAKTRIKGMEHDERMADKKYEHERYKIQYKQRKKIVTALIPVALFLLAFIMIGIFAGSAKISSNKQEKELQKIVDEIQVDIKNEDFDSAYIKAQSIKYTADWSSEIENKWDNTRKEVINQIIEAEKEATGKTSHKPEKDGWFDGWFD